jgi:ABC-type dipeptide/oligopeptide/nickel transport system permease subunit
MGIDGNVRDEFSRLVYGTRQSLIIGFTTVTFAIIVGTTSVLYWLLWWLSNVVMRLMDVLSLSSLLLAIAIVTVLGPGFKMPCLRLALSPSQPMRASCAPVYYQYVKWNMCPQLVRWAAI